MIVAISIFSLLAMVVLVVDVGALLVSRRAMVRAADSAALAAAQSCARASGDAEAQADKYAGANAEVLGNSGSDGGIIAEQNCGNGSGYVTVRYTTTQPLFFAGLFGDTEGGVSAEATAVFGGARASRPVPFVLVTGSFSSGNCSIPEGPGDSIPVGEECAFWFDNGGGGAAGFGNGLFGSLNLNKWDVPISQNCASKDLPGNIDYAEAGGYPENLSVNYPDPTWVCSGDGNSEPLYGALEANVGKIITFPLTEDEVPTDGKFNVVGFASMTLLEVVRAKDGAAGGDAGTCVSTDTFLGPNAPTVDLATLSGTDCPGTVPDVLTGLEVRGCGGAGNALCALGSDYDYDESTHTITWRSTDPPTTNPPRISFVWETFGVCGAPAASNDSGHCVRIAWAESTFGSGGVGGRPFNELGVQLCELDISGSCPEQE
ncbi:MAG: pilus assembly protein TadG-related protein [Actinomycetota bacterium]